MITKFVGVRKFRDNMNSYVKKSKKGVRYVILKKNVPFFELTPIDEKKFAMERLSAELEEAEKSVREGKVYSHEQVVEMLGLK